MISETTSLLAHKMRKLHSQSSDPAAAAENVRQLMLAQRQVWASRFQSEPISESSSVSVVHGKPILARHS
jgi:hypothetical protein